MTAVANPEYAIDVQGPEQALRRQACGARCLAARAPRRDFRISGTERQRQNHHHPHGVRTAQARLRQRNLPGL